VFFHAEGTTATGLDRDEAFLFLDYHWTFDDPTSGHWRTGALAKTRTPQSKNVEYSPTAGHLFETPGNYTVRLTVCNSAGDDCDTDTHLVTVADPDRVYAGNSTVCVSSPTPVAGRDGCPAGAKVYNSLDFDDLFNNSAGCNADEPTSHVRCLLRRGKTYTASQQIEFYSNRGVQVGAYGASGADPVVRFGRFALFDDHGDWADWTFYDLKLSSLNVVDTFGVNTVHEAPVHLALIRITDDGSGNLLKMSSGGNDGSRDHSGVYVYECSRTDHYVAPDNTVENFIYGPVRNFWYAGNTVGDPTNDGVGNDPRQDGMRLPNVQRAFLGHNIYHYGSGNGEELIKIHNTHKGAFGGSNVSTHSVVFADNELLHGGEDGWRVAFGTVSGSPSGVGELCEHFVIERNWYHSDEYVGSMDSSTNVFMMGNMKNVMIRNNIVDCSATNDTTHRGCLLAYANYRNETLAPPTNTYIFNNTVAHFGTAETCSVGVANVQSGSRNIDARANLVHAGGTATSHMWRGQGPTTDIDNLDASSNPFVSGRVGMRPDDFKLARSDNVTPVLGVRRDISGTVRTGGHTRGAWHRGGGGSSPPPVAQPPAAPVLLPPE
jgi:PKD repeat protein